MFRSSCCPAQRGDCLWLTYGTRRDLHHVLVDAGPQETIQTLVPGWRAASGGLPGRERTASSCSPMTHIDADHIQGVVSLLSGPGRVKLFRDVWFNGFEHLDAPMLGGPDGERADASLLQEPGRWNKAFDGERGRGPGRRPTSRRRARAAGSRSRCSRRPKGLTKLAPEWERVRRRPAIVPGQGAPCAAVAGTRGVSRVRPRSARARRTIPADRSAPNGASIALIASTTASGCSARRTRHAEVSSRARPARARAAPLQRREAFPSRLRRNTSLALLARIARRTGSSRATARRSGTPTPSA